MHASDQDASLACLSTCKQAVVFDGAQTQPNDHPPCLQQAWTFACFTFGCKVNQYETQAIREAWQAYHGQEVEDVQQAQVVLVNSCAITARAERDARNALLRLKRENPKAKLLLAGCASRLVHDFQPRKNSPAPQADLIIVQEAKERLCDPLFLWRLVASLPQVATKTTQQACCDTPKGNDRHVSSTPNATLARSASSLDSLQQEVPLTAMHWQDFRTRPWPKMHIEHFKRVRPVVKVQDGCTHRCTYCIVPYTRGPHVSRPPQEILAEIERLFTEHAELMISGVNLGQYGRDNKGFGDFWDLIERIETELAPRFAGTRRLRISSLEPSQLTPRACQLLGSAQLIAPHLHISLQHASQRILRRMGRDHYTKDTLTTGLALLQDSWPCFGLGADIIVGFPGETPQDVDLLCEFIAETPFSYAHVFPYSRRPGTPAASFSEQVERQEKMARAKRVREVVAHKAQAFWQAQAKLPSMQIALDAEEGHVLQGYVHGVNAYYAPCFVPMDALSTIDLSKERFLLVKPLSVCSKGILVEPLTSIPRSM